MEYVSIGLEWVLSNKNDNGYTYKEKSVKTNNPNIKHLKDLFGSHRFIYYKNGIAISGIQIMQSNNVFSVANVYTLKNERQKGYAKKLFNEAKTLLKTNKIFHSTNLSYEGKIFSKKVN